MSGSEPRTRRCLGALLPVVAEAALTAVVSSVRLLTGDDTLLALLAECEKLSAESEFAATTLGQRDGLRDACVVGLELLRVLSRCDRAIQFNGVGELEKRISQELMQ